MKKNDELAEFGDHLKKTQLAISEEMLRQGTKAYRRSLVGTASNLAAGGIIAATLYVQECVASGSSVEECENSWSDLSGGSRGRFREKAAEVLQVADNF